MTRDLGYTTHTAEDSHRWSPLLHPRGQKICIVCGEIRNEKDELVRAGKT